MNTDRLLRDIEKRLEHLPPGDRAEAVDAIREEIARERRHATPPATVETERQRRLEAETLRAILEAINRQGTLEETIEEVLKQLSKIVAFDSCSVALVDADDSFRVIAARGFPAHRPGHRDDLPQRAHRDPPAQHVAAGGGRRARGRPVPARRRGHASHPVVGRASRCSWKAR